MLAIAREKTKGIQRLNRDARGRFIEEKNIDFFAFPFEIRSMIYTHLFQYEKANRAKTIVHDPPSSFKMKNSLLQTSKVVRAEALPFLHRHHVFHISVPSTVTTTPTPRGYDSITKVQLLTAGNPHQILHYAFLSDLRFSCDPLQHVVDCLPNLQFLRVGLTADDLSISPYRNSFRADSPFSELLAKTWQRLSRLEIYVLHYYKIDTLELRQTVAPDAQWVMEACGIAALYGGARRTVWVAQRDGKPPRQSTRIAELP